MSGGLRLLQALAGASMGGAEMHFVRLALALDRAGVRQRVLIRPHEGRAAELRAAGIEPVELPFGGLFDFSTRRAFAREIADFRPDIVLSYMSRAARACPARMPGVDFVHAARLGGYYNMKYYRRCDHLIGITPDLTDSFTRQGWPRERVHFIPNFVPDRRPSKPKPRKSLATPKGVPLLFALGRLHRNKAFDVLLDALAGLPRAHLWLAGEGPARGELERQAARLGISERVRFLGWLDDPGPCFAAADVYVVPSRHEPLGSVLLEGWTHGVPMVAAASQGPRFVMSDGENGLLVPVDDAPALAAAIARLLDDRKLAARLVAAGRAAFEAEYTEAVAVGRYLDLFERIRR